MDLSENLLNGSIEPIGDLTALRALYLGENNFEANWMPPSFQHLYNLQDLSLRKTLLTGEIPVWISNMGNLIVLDLSDNKLTGTLPLQMGELGDLEFLMLNDNERLSGAMPQELSNLDSLRAIFLDGTNLTENVESVICALPSFLTPDDNKQIAFADCDGKVECECCECCLDGCSKPYQLNLRESWVKDFSKLGFEFNNETSFYFRDGVDFDEHFQANPST